MEIREIPVAPRSVSRRSFVKGVVAAGATVSATSYLFRSPGTALARTRSATRASQAERLVTLSVNGRLRPVDVLPQETLGATLRYKLGLTGTKYGCDRAECGACTVLVDGVPHYACSLFTHQVRGREVTTIEGLGSPEVGLHPAQQAALEEAGFQCAFCGPGFLMAMAGMLNANPNPTREQVRRLLSGNLCRCGDYDKILRTAMRAVELNRAAI